MTYGGTRSTTVVVSEAAEGLRTQVELRGTLENVPEELRRRRQWVVRKAKIPYGATTGATADTTDSETWSTFDEAVRRFEGGGYDGVGFVFGSGDPYAGVDLDKCRDPETGEIDPWAAEIVASLGGYAEVSPSGTGVHVIVRGKAPNRKRGKVEAYSVERYFTVTGEALEGAASELEIPERQAELDVLACEHLTKPPAAEPVAPASAAGRSPGPGSPEISDEKVIERCRRAKNAPKFVSLYDDGDTSSYDDDSDADLALLGILKFWTQDPDQLERLFGWSALGQRSKWRERPDYRRGTIEEALRGITQTYTPDGRREKGGARYDVTTILRQRRREALGERAAVPDGGSYPPPWRAW